MIRNRWGVVATLLCILPWLLAIVQGDLTASVDSQAFFVSRCPLTSSIYKRPVCEDVYMLLGYQAVLAQVPTLKP